MRGQQNDFRVTQFQPHPAIWDRQHAIRRETLGAERWNKAFPDFRVTNLGFGDEQVAVQPRADIRVLMR